MIKGINVIETLQKLNKAIPLVIDFISTHPQFLYQLREYAEKTGRTQEFQALIEGILEIIEKEGKNG